ncbi:MAG: Lrp/AsnC ligand binding domain-containing protein, partial [Alphaproteobacteria bacterium]|nr:Lrp/AsnC ligand binding domain-containing protein [Alphaproteobacteria bacterium]
YVSVTLASQAESALEAFEAGASRIAGVVECALVSGEHDYLLKVIAHDLADYERIHREELGKLPGVARIATSFVLRAIPTPGETAALLAHKA